MGWNFKIVMGAKKMGENGTHKKVSMCDSCRQIRSKEWKQSNWIWSEEPLAVGVDFLRLALRWIVLWEEESINFRCLNHEVVTGGLWGHMEVFSLFLRYDEQLRKERAQGEKLRMQEDGCWYFSLDQSLVSLPDVVNIGKYLLDLKEEHYYWLPEIRRLGIWLGDLSHCWKINLGTTRNQPRHTQKIGVVLVSQGCCNKLPKTGLLETTGIYSFMVM